MYMCAKVLNLGRQWKIRNLNISLSIPLRFFAHATLKLS